MVVKGFRFAKHNLLENFGDGRIQHIFVLGHTLFFAEAVYHGDMITR
jgi:hypothetical protein